MKPIRSLTTAALAVGLLAGCGQLASLDTPGPVTVATSDRAAAEKAGRALGLVLQLVTLPDGVAPVYVYAYDIAKPNVRGMYSQPVGHYDQILLDPQATTLTAVHELGHWLDYRAFDRMTTLGSYDATRVAVLLALGNSNAAFGLQMSSIDQAGAERGVWADYADDTNEMFARAFGQWVALRTADFELLQEINAKIDAGTNEQWSWGDFTEIALALDNLFLNQGTD